MPKQAIYFLVFVALVALGYFLWVRMQQGNVGGLSFMQAGAQKQAAVDAAASSATADGGATP